MREPALSGTFDDVRGPELLAKAGTHAKSKKPDLFRVLMINDDYTTTGFVREVLRRHFHKSQAQAIAITDQVHRKGIAVAGIYTFEIADTKANQVMAEARKHEYPFVLTLERDQ